MEDEDRWLTVEDLMEYLTVKRDTLYKWIDRNGLPAHKVGRLWRFQKSEIDEWVKSGKAADAGGNSDNV
jgi:excisionase family DNA binding protein